MTTQKMTLQELESRAHAALEKLPHYESLTVEVGDDYGTPSVNVSTGWLEGADDNAQIEYAESIHDRIEERPGWEGEETGVDESGVWVAYTLADTVVIPAYCYEESDEYLSSTDLAERREELTEPYETGIIEIADEAERAEYLYIPGDAMIGIAWGADADWGEHCTSVEDGIERWLAGELD